MRAVASGQEAVRCKGAISGNVHTEKQQLAAGFAATAMGLAVVDLHQNREGRHAEVWFDGGGGYTCWE